MTSVVTPRKGGCFQTNHGRVCIWKSGQVFVINTSTHKLSESSRLKEKSEGWKFVVQTRI